MPAHITKDWMARDAMIADTASMTRLIAFALLLLSALPLHAAEMFVSPWLHFSEAQLRLLLEAPKPGSEIRRGGIEIRLISGNKTYWRAPGDSGVPPRFDISPLRGLGAATLAFPFPGRFDDGAGGVSWGYKHHVILPFSVPALGKEAAKLHLALDFAVCDIMCIPLSGELALDETQGLTGTADDVAALKAAIARVPVQLAPEAVKHMVHITRLPGKPRWQLDVTPGAKDMFEAGNFAAFPEGKGYWMAGAPKPMPDGGVSIDITTEARPDDKGAYGPLRLTFGDGKHAYEAMIDLDGAARKP